VGGGIHLPPLTTIALPRNAEGAQKDRQSGNVNAVVTTGSSEPTTSDIKVTAVPSSGNVIVVVTDNVPIKSASPSAEFRRFKVCATGFYGLRQAVSP
jgi:hypothetical protein